MVTTRQTESSMSILTDPSTTMTATTTTTTKKAAIIKKQQHQGKVAPPPRRRRAMEKFAVRKASTTKFTKKNTGDNSNETVEVVKMLTGILYPYRGVNRRVEFVRKV